MSNEEEEEKKEITEAQRLLIFQAQTENVRLLKQAEGQITRTLKDALRKDASIRDRQKNNPQKKLEPNHYQVQIKVQTKILALIFCAWAEANFSKLIHTPHGFTRQEIRLIIKEQKRELKKGWKKCIELGLNKVLSASTTNFISDAQQKINDIIDEFVINPSILRNRIAHGQWERALNNANTDENADITNELKSLDLVVITKWFEVNKYLSNIVENLIESPGKAFERDYWPELSKLEKYLDKSRNYNIETLIQLLLRNPILS